MSRNTNNEALLRASLLLDYIASEIAEEHAITGWKITHQSGLITLHLKVLRRIGNHGYIVTYKFTEEIERFAPANTFAQEIAVNVAKERILGEIY